MINIIIDSYLQGSTQLSYYKVWVLHPDNPTTDLFATKINTQLPTFYSYRPDPDIIFLNAFSVDWANIAF